MDDRKSESLKAEIEETKVKLYALIAEKHGYLLDPEIIKLSQLLDKLLSQYDNIKK
ncbi:aspartyl-phosphate phosphatase Spo0E family protein [Clostridiaceae bacterium 35-E11]